MKRFERWYYREWMEVSEMVGTALRGALYYPYIHPRDAEWVKGTLLSLGQVNRIVPDEYPLHDLPEVAFLRDYPGPRNEPLVRSISPHIAHIEQATNRLAAVLERVDRGDLERRYGFFSLSDRRGGRRRQGYAIHKDKLHGALLDLLQRNDLAWPADAVSPSVIYAPDGWYAVHPELGEAIMSVVAIAAAKHDGLDIVTDSVPLHQALAVLDEQTILDGLLDPGRRIDASTTKAQAVGQLAHIIMTTTFDLSALSVEDVAILVSEGNDLRQFKAAIADAAAAIPLDAAPERREALLRQAAEGIVEEWNQFRRGMPRKLKSALREGAGDAAADLLKQAGDALKTAVGGGTTGGLAALVAGTDTYTIALVAGVGIAIGLATQVGKVFLGPKTEGPFRYLSRVEKAGATLLVVPRPYRPALRS